jgi:hypothetical protein
MSATALHYGVIDLIVGQTAATLAADQAEAAVNEATDADLPAAWPRRRPDTRFERTSLIRRPLCAEASGENGRPTPLSRAWRLPRTGVEHPDASTAGQRAPQQVAAAPCCRP